MLFPGSVHYQCIVCPALSVMCIVFSQHEVTYAKAGSYALPVRTVETRASQCRSSYLVSGAQSTVHRVVAGAIHSHLLKKDAAICPFYSWR